MASEDGWILRVSVTTTLLGGGAETHEMRVVPTAKLNASQAAWALLHEIRVVLAGEKTLLLNNPRVLYQCDKVVSIAFDFLNPTATADDAETFMQGVSNSQSAGEDDH